MDFEKAKSILQDRAGDEFPGDELWIRNDGLYSFFAVGKFKNIFSVIEGTVKKDNSVTVLDYFFTDCIEEVLEQKTRVGYECFAIEL